MRNEENRKKKFPITIVLDNIRSALNVGAIFRTCDAAGVEKLYLGGIPPYPPHNRIPKTALGAIDTVDWEYKKDTLKLCHKLKASSLLTAQSPKLISVEQTSKSITYTDYKFTPKEKYILVFGNEISGVGEEILKISDAHIEIPMFGEKESLNVATSVGVVAYEVVRQLTS